MWDIRLKTPFNMIIWGMTQSGKTTFIKNLLAIREQFFTQPPARVFYVYKVHQSIYDEMKKNELVHELIHVEDIMPSLDAFHKMMEPYKQEGSLFIFDDTISQLNTDFQQLFCNSSHHYNASIIFVSQILKLDDKTWREMSLNTHYMVLLNNTRDMDQVSRLSHQYNRMNRNFLFESYIDATHNKPYRYLFLDFKQDTPPTLKVLSQIFPNQFPVNVYLENR